MGEVTMPRVLSGFVAAEMVAVYWGTSCAGLVVAGDSRPQASMIGNVLRFARDRKLMNIWYSFSNGMFIAYNWLEQMHFLFHLK